ncbi:DUF4864 domain-containing protein [Tianweitania populi]|uniref:DUF4864 domain-containing protein n=1 Tax=Tianweitania populi TaxID=1607949 RepID=A0A8J3DPD5_9HYPH|nr:DUF4864 domain-containing protein [Tianweitania populi]GHD09220.1 DUF4864 domain-containing protein [Tianweitania populi]
MHRLFIAILLLGTGSAPTFAGEAEIKAAQSVIQRQMSAFRGNRDAEAYSFASPMLRMKFPNMAIFMSMVRQAYPMVHNPARYDFGTSKEVGNQIQQDVMILGADGKDYVATYTLQQQRDGSWLINSVTLRAGGTLST